MSYFTIFHEFGWMFSYIILQSNWNTKYLAYCCEVGQVNVMAPIPNPGLALAKNVYLAENIEAL